MKVICSDRLSGAAREFETLWSRVSYDDVAVFIELCPFSCDEEYEVVCGDRTIEIRAGRVRAAYYAVYDYFENAYGVSYHWDGDIYPDEKKAFCRVNIHTGPRFEYRGLRYFAHRGLHRFQAEMWSEDEWKHELDWLLKKRFNMFMLRIGGEDVFPLAFPDICDFAEGDAGNPERHGFDDRTPISTLEERSQLRGAICKMAKERDLIQPVDCGTMTHWYSRTPRSFIDSEKPTFLSQTTSIYADKCGLVWDIRDDRNLENYFRITKAYVDNFGHDGLFHTIGLAERLFSADRTENLELKKYTYRRISEFLKKQYPASKLLVGSWDFSMFWHNDEVSALLDELNPEQCIIFDYTSDTLDEKTNFENWGVVGRFPYIFGIFHAYEPSNGVRGDYERIERRLKTAAEDPYCKGFVTWQELSHGDSFMLEYTAANAWQPVGNSRAELLPRYCTARFGKLARMFERIYNELYPVTSLFVWGGDKENEANNFFNDYTYDQISTPITRTPIRGELKPEYRAALEAQLEDFEKVSDAVKRSGILLAETKELLASAQQRREWYDLERSRRSAIIHFGIIRTGLLLDDLRHGKNVTAELRTEIANVIFEEEALAKLLGEHPDYSLAETMKTLRAAFNVNPYFERVTIKENTVTEYCRSCIYEVFDGVTVAETRALARWIDRVIAGKSDGREYDETLKTELKALTDAYLNRAF